MGASESTNRTTEEEEERQQRRAAAVAAIATGVAAVGMAAWGISKMLSDGTDHSQQKQDSMQLRAQSSYSNSSSLLEGMPPPSRRRFKMKTDGACRPNQGSQGGYIEDGSVMRGPSGYGGILLDDGGKWFRGFRGFIEESDCLTAEFHGVLKGLEMLVEHGVVDSTLESDSKAAVEWISGKRLYRGGRSEVIDEECWEMIQKCKRLKNKNRITVSFCSRNDNKCADKLASMGIDKGESYVELMYPPDEIKDMIY